MPNCHDQYPHQLPDELNRPRRVSPNAVQRPKRRLPNRPAKVRRPVYGPFYLSETTISNVANLLAQILNMSNSGVRGQSTGGGHGGGGRFRSGGPATGDRSVFTVVGGRNTGRT